MMTMTIQRMKTRNLYILAELDIIKKRYYYKIKAEVTLMRGRDINRRCIQREDGTHPYT